jgi:hypothetical protein
MVAVAVDYIDDSGELKLWYPNKIVVQITV